MRDFIYDQVTGKCIAYVENGAVFADKSGTPKIATVRAGNLYDLNGELVGHLQGAHVTGLRTEGMPVSFARLLSAVPSPD